MRNIVKLSIVFLFTVLGFTSVFAQEFMLPNDVENVKATPLDGAVKLTWDKSEDPDGVILGYKIYYGTTPVETSDDTYADEILTGSSENSFLFSNLKNEVQYFFSVTAIDDEENESENYSLEVASVPMPEISDVPSVLSAEQVSLTEVKVKMSESVTVKSLTNSFYIKEKNNPRAFVDIITTKLDGIFVTLVIESLSLTPSTTYVVTATSTVEDYEGNPVSSGITDATEFLSKSAEVIQEEIQQKKIIEEQEQMEAEAAAQQVTTENTQNGDVTENLEMVDLDYFAKKEAEEKAAASNTVMDSTYTNNTETDNYFPSNDTVIDSTYTNNTETNNYVPSNDTVIDSIYNNNTETNNYVPSNNSGTNNVNQNTKTVVGTVAENEVSHGTAFVQDKTPPLSVQEVSVDTAKVSGDGYVEIAWEPSMDVDQDIIDQILYTREEGGDWDSGYSIGKTTTDLELEVDPEKNYEVKIVTLDSSGNRTEGKVMQFSTKLMKSGAGTVVGFSIALVFSMLLFVSRRRVS